MVVEPGGASKPPASPATARAGVVVLLKRSIRYGLKRLGGRDRWEVVGFLREQVEHNAFLLGQIARDALHRESVAGIFVGYYGDGALEGVLCVGSNLVISEPCSARAVEAFALYARESGWALRVAVGPEAHIAAFMDRYGRDPREIAMERPRELLYRVDHTQLCGPGPCAELRLAEVTEVERLMRADLAMVSEELGFDPFSQDLGSFRDGWLRRIRERRAWVVGIIDQPPIFKVEASAVSEDVVQISGVYTTPRWRRQGLAQRAIGGLCHALLEEVPVVTLYVHRENTPAIRLYEALGFVLAGEVRSVWFY